MVKTWRDGIAAPSTLGDLLSTFYTLQKVVNVDGEKCHTEFAFRGMANAEHDLKPSLHHKMNLVTHDGHGLAVEQDLVRTFVARGKRFLVGLDNLYLGTRDQKWDDPHIWGTLAVARHYGVPTRLLDWTHNVCVAAFFAACHERGFDGAVWWFSQVGLEKAVHQKWDSWGVPLHKGSDQRAIEAKAFTVDASPWISKVHLPVEFPRLQKQAGFFTACGQLGMTHNHAIDALDDEQIERGRVIVRSGLKEQLLDYLELIGFRASTIDYPGADAEAAGIVETASSEGGRKPGA